MPLLCSLCSLGCKIIWKKANSPQRVECDRKSFCCFWDSRAQEWLSSTPGWTGQVWGQLWGDLQAGGWKGCDHQRICSSRIRMHPLTSINKMHFALAFIGRNSAYKVTLKEGTERKMSAQRGKSDSRGSNIPFGFYKTAKARDLPIPRASQAVTLGHTPLPPQNKPFKRGHNLLFLCGFVTPQLSVKRRSWCSCFQSPALSQSTIENTILFGIFSVLHQNSMQTLAK